MAIDPITNKTNQPVTSNQDNIPQGSQSGQKKPDDVDETAGPRSQYLQKLKDAGIDPDAFQAAIKEARSEGVKPGTQAFGDILQKHGIDPTKIPQPPAGLGGREGLHHGHHHKKKVQSDETYDQMLEDAGIDPSDYDAAVAEAEDAGVDPGTDAFSAILQSHGIDPTKVPPPPVTGNEGGPSSDGHRFSAAKIDPKTVIDRVFGDTPAPIVTKNKTDV